MKGFYLFTCLFVMIPVFAIAHSDHMASPTDPPVVEKTLDPSEDADHNHEGHQHDVPGPTSQIDIASLVRWIGHFHLISIHFPIALIIVTVIAEVFYWFLPALVFANAARFMVMMAAVTVIPTALFGWAHSTGVTYPQELYDTFWWHRFCGIGTAVFAVLAAIVSEFHWRKDARYTKLAYYLLLVGAAIFVSFTGFLGGELTFGVGHLSFPGLHL